MAMLRWGSVKSNGREQINHANGQTRVSGRDSFLERIKQDLTRARRIQRNLLPKRNLKLSGLEVASAYLPAHDVGGDYYDVLELSDRSVGLCIADVSGKGLSSALMMASLHAALRLLAHKDIQPRELMSRINRFFYENSLPEIYSSFFYGVYDDAQKSLTYCNAGHFSPLFFTAHSVRELSCNSTVLGLLPNAEYLQAKVAISSGDILVAYSDGLLELRNSAGEEFGKEHIIALVEENHAETASNIRDLLLRKAERFSSRDHWEDDFTLLVIKSVPVSLPLGSYAQLEVSQTIH